MRQILIRSELGLINNKHKGNGHELLLSFLAGGSWLLGWNPFPFFPVLCLHHAAHKVQDAAMCGFRFAAPEASHHTGWVETPSPRVLAGKQWTKPNASSLPHTFSAQAELLGQPAGLTAAVTWWATTLCYSFWEVLQRISSIHADLQETRQFPNLSETLWHSYWKSSHLGKGRYKLTSFVTSIHLVSSWCKGR